MTLRVSLDIAKSVGICEQVMPAIIKYYEDNNLESATLDEMIALWKSLGQREWALWLYSKRRLFEKLTGEISSPEEVAFYEADEAYLNAKQVVGYMVNNVRYDALPEAEIARQNRLAELKEEIEPLCVCSLEILHANGDSTWQVIDLDDFAPPTDIPYTIKVFNPIDGRYVTFHNQVDALACRDDFIIQTTDHQNGSSVIRELKQHPDFPNEEPTF